MRNYITSDLPADIRNGLNRKIDSENFDYYAGENGMRYTNQGGLMRCRYVFNDGQVTPRPELCTKANIVGNSGDQYHEIMPFRTLTERRMLSLFTLDHE